MFKLFFRMVDILIVVSLNQQLNSKKQKHNQYIYKTVTEQTCLHQFRRFCNFSTNEMLSLFLTKNRIINLIWNIHEKNTDYGYRYNVFIISSYMSPYIALQSPFMIR